MLKLISAAAAVDGRTDGWDEMHQASSTCRSKSHLSAHAGPCKSYVQLRWRCETLLHCRCECKHIHAEGRCMANAEIEENITYLPLSCSLRLWRFDCTFGKWPNRQFVLLKYKMIINHLMLIFELLIRPREAIFFRCCCCCCCTLTACLGRVCVWWRIART